MSSMVIRVWRPSGFSGTRAIDVSVPLVPQLLEAPSRYRLPGQEGPPSEPRRARGSNMKTLLARVKARLAAEEYEAPLRFID